MGRINAHLTEENRIEGVRFRVGKERIPRGTKQRQMSKDSDDLSQVSTVEEDRWVEALVGEEQEQHVLAHYQAYFQDDGQKRPPVPRLLDVNLRTYLLDDLLVKVDRCSMAVSLEARSPFLDHHLLEFANGIPSQFKLRQGKTKYILKQAMRGLLPDSIIDRQKHGFGVPVGAWFRGDLAEYVRAVLLSERAMERGIFERAGLQAMLDSHQGGQTDLGHALWTLLTFELWMQRYFD